MYLNLSVEITELCMFLVMETKDSINYKILAGSLVSSLVVILVTVTVITSIL